MHVSGKVGPSTEPPGVSGSPLSGPAATATVADRAMSSSLAASLVLMTWNGRFPAIVLGSIRGPSQPEAPVRAAFSYSGNRCRPAADRRTIMGPAGEEVGGGASGRSRGERKGATNVVSCHNLGEGVNPWAVRKRKAWWWIFWASLVFFSVCLVTKLFFLRALRGSVLCSSFLTLASFGRLVTFCLVRLR